MPPPYSPEDRYGAYRPQTLSAPTNWRDETHGEHRHPLSWITRSWRTRSSSRAFPGIGNVGKLAAEHLKDELKR